MMNYKRVSGLLKWLSRIVLTLSLLWVLLFVYLSDGLGDFFGPPDWPAILLVAFAGFVIGFLLRWVSRRLIGDKGV